jgi:hypothetical protein
VVRACVLNGKNYFFVVQCLAISGTHLHSLVFFPARIQDDRYYNDDQDEADDHVSRLC